MYPSIGITGESRYPDLRTLATAQVEDPAPPGSKTWPTLGERIVAALRRASCPLTIAEVAERIGCTPQNCSNWFRDCSRKYPVKCVGIYQRTQGAKASKLWVAKKVAA